MATQHSQDPRRLLVLFLVATLVPAASLVWLGWRMVQQDRTLEGQHEEEQAKPKPLISRQRRSSESWQKRTIG